MSDEKSLALRIKATFGEVVPFPMAARGGVVARRANRFVNLTLRSAEADLARQIQIQRETLLRYGVDSAIVEEQARELDAAVRSAAARLLLNA